ncbi:MAG: hypothetical protein OSB09_08425 [Planctomycetota bacterium]|nr:hypothetical protein [Planctomycetota bacterium]
MIWPLLTLVLLTPLTVEDAAASYTISLDDAAQHRVTIEAVYPAPEATTLELWMPVWTPGSYKIRDYSRHIEDLHAFDAAGEALTIHRPSKNRWIVETQGTGDVTVRYRLYCRILSVRTNFIEAGSGFLNGAATFLLPRGKNGPFDISFDLASQMKQVVTSLPETTPDHWRARDIDHLCDSPILLGNPEIRDFVVDSVPHSLVNLGGEDLWDSDACAEDVQKICEELVRFWGQIPYSSYQYLNVIAEGGGGLEHKDCALMLAGRWTWGDEDRRKGWYGLISHEQFHAWNGKRLRPEALGPFEYEQEVFTPDLWFVEGFTSYYDELIIARAGLIDQKHYLEGLGKQIKDIQKTPGRLVLPLSRASTDAWIRYYQRDENSVNSQISYYTKGAMVAWLLDARIRTATHHKFTLDDGMRLAFKRYSGEVGYSHDQLREVFEEVAGTDLSDWFQRFIDGTDELEYEEALETFGLRFEPDSLEQPKEPPKGWLGIEAGESGGRWSVTRVRRGTPAYLAGLNPGDELIGLDQFRLSASTWKQICRQYPPASEATLLVSRRGALVSLTVLFGEDPGDQWKIQPDPEASEEQVARRVQWLGQAGEKAQESPSEKAPESPKEANKESSGR